MRKKALFLSWLVCLPAIALSQTLFEDAKGESSMFLSRADWFWARVNTGDASVTLGANRFRHVGFDGHNSLLQSYRYFYGADLKVSVDNGTGSLLSGGQFSPGASLSFNYGIQGRNPNDNTINDYMLYFSGGASYDKYKLIDTLNYQVNEQKKFTLFGEVHYNKVWTHNFGASKQRYFFLGLSAGLKGTNNMDDLKDGSFNTTRRHKDSLAITTVQAGKLGDYVGYTSLPIKADFGILPSIFDKNIIGFNVYARLNLRMPNNPLNTGAGIFFSDKDSPTSVIGGLAWQFNGINYQGDQLKNSSVFFYVGYTIK